MKLQPNDTVSVRVPFRPSLFMVSPSVIEAILDWSRVNDLPIIIPIENWEDIRLIVTSYKWAKDDLIINCRPAPE